MYIRLVAEITSHLFQALTSSLSLSLAPSLFSTFFSFPGPVSVSILSLSLSLSLRPPSIPNPFIPTKSTRARSWVEYRRFREILRKNLHNFRNCLLMLEMKEAAATEWSSESFRLFLYKFSFVLFSLDSSRFFFGFVEIANLRRRTIETSPPHSSPLRKFPRRSKSSSERGRGKKS